MTRLAAILLVAPGCFYVQPINQRPSADIHPESSATVYRKDTIALDAVTADPEGQPVHVQWRAYACGDATTPSGCDEAPFYTELLDVAHITVPAFRDDNTTPTQALRVILEATDDHGATAKPSQELLIPVEDQPPTVKLDKSSRYGYVVNTSMQVFAKVDDPDDTAARLLPLDWMYFSPPGTPPDHIDNGDPGPTQYSQTFTPHVVGDYDVQVTATDPLGLQTTDHVTITVAPDHVPCLEQWSPLAGGTFPMQDPTLFQVLFVQDDLDGYPAASGDPVLGQTAFSWTLLPPGATQRQPLDVVGNSVALDPSNYKPGDVLELRVQIEDRNHIDATNACPDTDATCSVISDASCIQRLTWRVEVQ